MTKLFLFLSQLALIYAPFSGIEKLISDKTHIRFFSTTPAEDIEAHNYKSVGTLNTSTGDIVFSVPMQGFEFKKALMQKHFNQPDFLDTKMFPKAKLVGKIVNIASIDFTKDGAYEVEVEGEMELHGVTKTIKETGTVTLAAGKVSVKSVFNLTLADYNVLFSKGKPSKNIAKTVEVTVEAEYKTEE